MASPTLLPLETISQAAFAPFGTVIEPPSAKNPLALRPGVVAVPANQGTALRFPDVAPLAASYPFRPGTTPARPQISLFACAPRTLRSENTVGGAGHYLVIDVPVLERHPYTSQTFSPLGFDSAKYVYIVVVAPSTITAQGMHVAPGDNPPDLSRLRAFLATGSQAVTYGAGVWHSPMIVVRKDGLPARPGDRASFVVTQWVTDMLVDNVQEEPLAAVGVAVPPPEVQAASKL